jgi:hypothetical protein
MGGHWNVEKEKSQENFSIDGKEEIVGHKKTFFITLVASNC